MKYKALIRVAEKIRQNQGFVDGGRQCGHKNGISLQSRDTVWTNGIPFLLLSLQKPRHEYKNPAAFFRLFWKGAGHMKLIEEEKRMVYQIESANQNAALNKLYMTWRYTGSQAATRGAKTGRA